MVSEMSHLLSVRPHGRTLAVRSNRNISRIRQTRREITRKMRQTLVELMYFAAPRFQRVRPLPFVYTALYSSNHKSVALFIELRRRSPRIFSVLRQDDRSLY